MKQFIPAPLRVQLRVAQRYVQDAIAGHLYSFTSSQPLTAEEILAFTPQITITQALLKTSHSENKRHNLKLAIQQIENVAIAPQQIFSFWHLVGKPDAKRGYLEGRAIINDRLQTDIGGGLCQLSGLLYWLALKANLPIIERHPHSKDIYTEATRFAPLGSDATIVYGYKDLRFQNPLDASICFRFDVEDEQISASLCATKPIEECIIEFQIQEFEYGKCVNTVRSKNSDDESVIINTTRYSI